jgi:predicted nucleic acid-binding protein
MSILIDTNILTRTADTRSTHHTPAVQSVRLLLTRGEMLIVVPQIFYEFWAVATRPTGSPNGLGMTTAQARAESDLLRQTFTFLPDTPEVFQEWERLVVQYDAKGKSAHDARIVAAMNVHHIPEILTFNGSDFARYPITVLDPSAVAQLP